MASSLSPSSPVAIFRPNLKFRSIPLQASQIRAQSYRVEAAGRSSKIVDANLSRERIDQKVKVKDWNSAAGYNYELKREAQMLELFELVRLILGTLGFIFLSGTTLLFLVYILVHMNQ
ncbi:hypothetical protein SLE2022_274960 [Rubroshorea leprosula]